MSINEEVDKVKTPKGKFAVCLWDGYPMRMEPPLPEIVETFDAEKDADRYAKAKNEELRRDFYDKGGEKITPELMLVYLMDGRSRMIEPEYFVMDDRGCRT